jgi:hypothetical protein
VNKCYAYNHCTCPPGRLLPPVPTPLVVDVVLMVVKKVVEHCKHSKDWSVGGGGGQHGVEQLSKDYNVTKAVSMGDETDSLIVVKQLNL